MTDPRTQPPPLHSNGSGYALLHDNLCIAIHALQDAQSALQATAPHMRDYYVHPDGDARYASARSYHRARLAKLEALVTELTQQLEALASEADRINLLHKLP